MSAFLPSSHPFFRRSRGILLLVTFALVGSLLTATVLHLRKKSAPLSIAGIGGPADVKIGNFTVVQTQGEGRQWELVAKRAELFAGRQEAVLEGVAVTLHRPVGGDLLVRGDRGLLDTARKNFFLENMGAPLEISLDPGTTLVTEGVRWNNDRREIEAVGPVRIRGRNFEVSGQGLIVKVVPQEFQVSGDVRLSLR